MSNHAWWVSDDDSAFWTKDSVHLYHHFRQTTSAAM
jgi:hypothetical protein